MAQVSTRIPDQLLKTLDEELSRTGYTRADIIRLAIEYHLGDAEDLRLALERLQDPADPVLDWAVAKRDPLAGN